MSTVPGGGGVDVILGNAEGASPLPPGPSVLGTRGGSIYFGSTLLGAVSVELAARIEAEISPQDAYHFTPVGWERYLSATNPFPPMPHWLPIRLGSLRWPVWASRWAVGYYLAAEEQVNAIRQQVYATGYQPLTLAIDDGVQQISTKMWMLPPRPLAQWPWLTYSGPQWSASNGLNLVTLVDDRYFWWEKASNITITTGTTTWTELLASIATALGITIHVDAIAAAYLMPPASLVASYQHLPPLLDQVCQSIGHRLVRRLDGSVWTQTASTAATWQDKQCEAWPRYKGGEFRFQVGVP